VFDTSVDLQLREETSSIH